MSWYEKIKQLFEDNRQTIVLIVCFILVFIAGFGTGKAIPNSGKSVSSGQQNYTTFDAKAQKVDPKPAVQGDTTVVVDKKETTGTPKGECVVKGNVSGQSKIYHVKGGASYEKTNPEQCFATEEEAKAAGFRKSSR